MTHFYFVCFLRGEGNLTNMVYFSKPTVLSTSEFKQKLTSTINNESTHVHHALWVHYRCRHCTISREFFLLKQHQFNEVVKHGDEEITTKTFHSSSWWKYHGAFQLPEASTGRSHTPPSRFYIPYKVKGNLPLHVCGQTLVHSFSIQSSSWRLSSSTAHLLDKSKTGSPKK